MENDAERARNPGFPWLVLLRLMKEFDIEIPPARPFVCSFHFLLSSARVRADSLKVSRTAEGVRDKNVECVATRSPKRQFQWRSEDARKTTEIRRQEENLSSRLNANYWELYFESFTNRISLIILYQFIGIDLSYSREESRNILFHHCDNSFFLLFEIYAHKKKLIVWKKYFH